MSYNLSILSRFYFYMLQAASQRLERISFNPIKVLFLPVSSGIFSTTAIFFQSYQGSIFTRYGPSYAYMRINFQSYQGSIFTQEGEEARISSFSLSILSRFYFYAFLYEPSYLPFLLSILSRFYFYMDRVRRF